MGAGGRGVRGLLGGAGRPALPHELRNLIEGQVLGPAGADPSGALNGPRGPAAPHSRPTTVADPRGLRQQTEPNPSPNRYAPHTRSLTDLLSRGEAFLCGGGHARAGV